jgi:hypothetical protein
MFGNAVCLRALNGGF